MKKNISTLFSVLAISFSASSAFAEISCPQFVPVPFSTIETKINTGMGGVIEGKNIDCKKVGLAANMIGDIRKMLAPNLSTPKQIIFRMVDTFDNAFFDPSEISLNVPNQLMIEKYAKNPIHTIPVWAHEYGHAVLDHNLKAIAPSWYKAVRARAVKSAGTPEEIVDALIGSYHEFFADVVAVLYTGKGDAVARSLFMTGFVANPEGKPSDCPASDNANCRPDNASAKVLASLVTPRDFTARANQMGRWRGTSPFDVHNLLAPARFHIYKYYLSNPAYHGMNDKLAGTAVDAIIGDMSRRIARMKDANGQITREAVMLEMGDVQRVNREFISTLDAYYAKSFR